jgi:AcrR family transcriptional regulator
MPRWPADARERIVSAALALFDEHGYAATTVDHIVARAEVSQRTYFRHFPDKAEVLFADDDLLLPVLVGLIADDRSTTTAEAMMTRTLAGLAAAMEPQRDLLRRRQTIVETDVALTGRELAKQARWEDAVARALESRGFGGREARLLAAIGFALFREVAHEWLRDRRRTTLETRVRSAVPELAGLMAVPVPDRAGASA